MCDTIVVVRPGEGVLFAKNSDRDANEAQLLEWHPAASHEPGTRLRCTWIEIPQVKETHAVLLSRPFWMWGAEIGANDQGVTIGNEAVFTRQPYARSGLTGMDLVRLALERASKAREAVEVITDLLKVHGQGGGCGHEDRAFTYHNSFLVADPSSAYVVETAGRLWAVEQVTGSRSISNGLTIEGFAERQSDLVKTWGSRCRIRRGRTTDLASSASSAADLMELLRDHGEGADSPRYSSLFGGLEAPCAHAGGMVVNSQTTASWVADLRPGRIRHWATGTSAPCTGLFKPVAVDHPIDIGAPTDRCDETSLWWRHERLHRRVVRNPAELLPLYRGERDELEQRWLADQTEPAEAFADADRALARWTDEVARRDVADVRPRWARRYWEKRNERAGISIAP